MMLKDTLILSSQRCGLQYLLMVASGMVMIVGTQGQRTTRIFGKRSEIVISSTTRRLHPALKAVDGQL